MIPGDGGIRCQRCSSVYCSERCLSEAEGLYHRRLCSAGRGRPWVEFERHAREAGKNEYLLAARMLATVLSEDATEAMPEPEPQPEPELPSELAPKLTPGAAAASAAASAELSVEVGPADTSAEVDNGKTTVLAATAVAQRQRLRQLGQISGRGGEERVSALHCLGA